MFSCVFNILQSVHFSWLSVWSKSCQYWKEIASLLAFCIHASAILHVIFHLVWKWCQYWEEMMRCLQWEHRHGVGAGCWRVHILMSRVFLDAQALGDLALMTSIIKPRFLTWLAWLKKMLLAIFYTRVFSFMFCLWPTKGNDQVSFYSRSPTFLPEATHSHQSHNSHHRLLSTHPPGLPSLALKWCRPPHWMCDLQNFDVPFVLNSCRSNFDWRS